MGSFSQKDGFVGLVQRMPNSFECIVKMSSKKGGFYKFQSYLNTWKRNGKIWFNDTATKLSFILLLHIWQVYLQSVKYLLSSVSPKLRSRFEFHH